MRPARVSHLLPILALPLLAACQDGSTASDAISVPGDNSALSTMERIAVAAQKCWFGPQADGFEGLAMSPELTSFSGKPRILAVPRGNLGGLPKLVVEATGKPARISAYGPLAEGPHAAAIASDTRRWAGGDSSCAARG